MGAGAWRCRGGLGGQTPLKLARSARGRRHPGAGHEPRLDRPRRGPRALPRAVRRARHRAAARRHRLPPPRRRAVIADGLGFPVLVRPSYVLGGRAMQIVYDVESRSTRRWPSSPPRARLGREGGLSAERPVLVDRFLEDAVEVDVDAHPRRHRRRRHRRRDGAHRGGGRALRRLRVRDPAADAAPGDRRAQIETQTHALADALDVRGLLNVQYAVKDGERLRDRGQPARQPHGAVREQGDRRAAGQGRGAGDGRRHARRAARRGAAAPAGRTAATSR